MRALVMKEFRELARDHRTVAMLIVMPVLLLTIFGYAANFSIERVSVIVVGPQASALAEKLTGFEAGKEGLDIISVDSSLGQDDAERLLRERKADAVVVSKDSGDDATLEQQMAVYLDGSELFAAQSAARIFLKIYSEDAQNRISDVRSQVDEARASAEKTQTQLKEFMEQVKAFRTDLQQFSVSGGTMPTFPTVPEFSTSTELPEISAPSVDTDSAVTVLFNPDLKTSWVLVPGLIGLILTFIGTIITAIGLVREREAGTLEQLAVMPLSPSAIIMGKILPYFFLAVFDLVLVTTLGIWLFKVPFVGSFWLFGLGAVIFLFVVLGLGVLLSSISQNTGQAVQMAIMVVLPQVLLSGLIFPLDSMAAGVRWIGYLLPLTWFNIISQGILLRGATLESLWLPLLILAGQAVVIFGVATARMRYSLTHGGGR